MNQSFLKQGEFALHLARPESIREGLIQGFH